MHAAKLGSLIHPNRQQHPVVMGTEGHVSQYSLMDTNILTAVQVHSTQLYHEGTRVGGERDRYEMEREREMREREGGGEKLTDTF